MGKPNYSFEKRKRELAKKKKKEEKHQKKLNKNNEEAESKESPLLDSQGTSADSNQQ